MRNRLGGGIAIGVVERLHVDGFDRRRVEAVHVDVVAVGVRARHVERLDSTDAAEAMLRRAGVECVLGQRIGAGEQAKTRGGHDQMQVAAHATDRTIALECGDACGRVDFEANGAAMAAAAMGDEHTHVRGGMT